VPLLFACVKRKSVRDNVIFAFDELEVWAEFFKHQPPSHDAFGVKVCVR
jgi:hypothetical protein